jgi:hypothetical protein
MPSGLKMRVAISLSQVEFSAFATASPAAGVHDVLILKLLAEFSRSALLVRRL